MKKMENQEVQSQIQTEKTLAVNAPEIYCFDVGVHYRVEVIMAEPDVIFHLFIYSRPWPEHMKKRIVRELDKRIDDRYTTAYEKVADSWFIRIFDFCSTRMMAQQGAKGLIEGTVKSIIKEEIENGSIRVPGA